jgi:hypothetical protein
MATAASNVPELSGDSGTATAAAGAATCNHQLCVITTEALTTAAAADYTLTLTNTYADVGGLVFVSVGQGTNTTVPCFWHSISITADNTIQIKVRNAHASAALNGTLVINVLVL